MGEDKKTQLGTAPSRTARPTGSPPIAAAADAVQATGTPVPSDDPVAASKVKTSYLPEAPDPLLGTTVAGRYQIIKKLGEGGMGAVYLALHTVLEKQVALKVLHGEFARKPDLVERFMQEAKAASRIRHENVIDISDFGATPEGLVFFAMELLQGHDLHEEITRAKLSGHLLPWSRTKKIFLQICSALSAAHARGIVHRDLKPENVYLVEFLGDPDFVKLLDFGIAKLTDVSGAEEGARKLTKTGMLFGTPEYMSPEQARGDQVDHRVDIYAMGCILFQLVANRVPFEAENFMGVLSQHLTVDPPQIAPVVFDQIGAPRELAQVIDKALLKDRDQRYQTIDELAAAVREVSGDPPPADKSTKMRAPSVPSPGETTRARPPTGPVETVRDKGTGRVKTQWTGNLTVPQETAEAPPAARKSKLPLAVVGGIVLLGAAIGVAVVMTSRKGTTAAPESSAAGGSAQLERSGSAAVVAPEPPPPPPPPPEPDPLPAMAAIVLDSTPSGAKVIELVEGKEGKNWGKTPASIAVPGSAEPRRFKLVLRGYGDSVVEVVPNRARIEFTQPLIKGATKPGAAVTQVPDPVSKPEPKPDTTKPDVPVTTPDAPKPTPTVKPDPVPDPTPKPEPPPSDPPKPDGSATKKPDCPDDEVPCLKSFP